MNIAVVLFDRLAILRNQPRTGILPSLVGNDTAIDIESKPLMIGQPDIQRSLDGQIRRQRFGGLDVQDVGVGMESVGWSKDLNLQRRRGGIVMVGFGPVKIVHGESVAAIRESQVPNVPIFRQLRPGQMKGRQKIVIGNEGFVGWW